MIQSTLEERVERLEQVVQNVVDQLSDASTNAAKPKKKNWRQTIGMFDGDPVMDAIIDEALESRAQERRQFYEAFERGDDTA